MRSCLESVFCCWKSATANRLFYQNSDSDEHGIEYDRLIELPLYDTQATRGRLAAPQLILNERERHLISNKLYSEYADDQDRYDRLKGEESMKDEEALAEEEDEYYAEKAAKVREFYQNRPATASTSANPTSASATSASATSASATQDFADFSERFRQHPSQVSTPRDYTTCQVSDSVSNRVLHNQPNVSVTDPRVDVQDSVPVSNSVPVSDSVPLCDEATRVTTAPLSLEQSNKLLEHIDTILHDNNESSSSDISEFYPDNASSGDGPDPDIVTMVTTGNSSTLPDTSGYFLTNVVLDSSPSPEFVDVVSSRSQRQDSETEGIVTMATASNSETEEGSFDPFREFERKNSSSPESFVEVE